MRAAGGRVPRAGDAQPGLGDLEQRTREGIASLEEAAARLPDGMVLDALDVLEPVPMPQAPRWHP